MFFVFRGISRAWVAGLAQLVPSPNNNKKGEIKICNYNRGVDWSPSPLAPLPLRGLSPPVCLSFFRCFEGGILYLNFRFLKVFPYCYRGKSTLYRVYRLICGVACAFAIALSLISLRYRLSVISPTALQSSLNL